MDLSGYQMTRTETEKLAAAFLHKYRNLWCRNLSQAECEQNWFDYLDGLDGVEHIRKFSDMSDPLDHLLDSLNNKCGDMMVVRDPHNPNQNFIIIEKEFAQKILVLGILP